MRTLLSICFCMVLFGSLVLAQSNPVPLINNPLVPDAAAPGGQSFTLTVNGTGFVSGSAVNWSGTALATNFVSGSQLTATVPAANIATAGTASVNVVNPASGGGVSNTALFDVRSSFPAASFGFSAINAGVNPGWFTVADLNRDGIPDLVTTSSYTDPTVYIMLGNGDGTFQAPVSYAIAQDSEDVIAADFNGDGILDLAATAGNYISILIGDGDGTFQPHQDFSANVFGFIGLSAADFNGDGKLDIAAVVAYPMAQVAVFLGNGDGTFQNAMEYPAGSSDGYYLTAGDFNGDGKIDVAVALFYEDAVSVLLGNGDGSFQNGVEYPAAPGTVDVVAADFNGDGKLDLAALGDENTSGGNKMSVLLGNGDGTFQNQVDYPISDSGYAIAAADVNGDGKVDLIATSATTSKVMPNTIDTFLGKGDGTFQPPSLFPVGQYPAGVATGDFNGDGLTDIVSANVGDGTASVLLQISSVLSTTNVSFGKVNVGSSMTQKVTLSNISNSALTISRIGLKGRRKAQFSESNNCGASLAPGANCAITLKFKPADPGLVLGVTVEIFDSAVNVPQIIYLSGRGED